MNQLRAAFADLEEGVRLAPVWAGLGWDQTMSRFHRTVLGPFWLSSGVISMAFALSFVFGGMMGGTDWRNNFEFVLIGIMVWNLMGASLADGANAFINGANMAVYQRLPLSFHIFLHMYRTLVNVAAQFITVEVMLLIIGRFHIPTVALVPGFLVVFATTFFLSFVAAVPSTRYRDVSYTFGLAMSVLFFMTPVFWHVESMGRLQKMVLKFNPLAHELEVIRQPLMGLYPTTADWIWTVGTLAAAGMLTIALLWAYRRRLIFWL